VNVTGHKAGETVAIARFGKPSSSDIADQATARVESDVPATATITVGSAAGDDATARITTVSPDSKPAGTARRSGQRITGTFAGSSVKPGEAVAGSQVREGKPLLATNLSRASDVLFVTIPRQFPEDYSVVTSVDIKVNEPSLTLKARWEEGDTETLRTIKVSLSEASSTAIVRLEPIRSVEWTDGKMTSRIGDAKSGGKFSLMQFELIADKVIKVKCWAEKSENAEAAAAKGPSFPDSTTIRPKVTTGNSEAKAVSGVTFEATGSASASASAGTPKAGDASSAAASATDAKPAEAVKKP